MLAFNQKMMARRRGERELGDTADPSKCKKTAPAPEVRRAEEGKQAIRGLGRVGFFPGSDTAVGNAVLSRDSLSVDAIGIDYQVGASGTAILNFSPSRMPSAYWTAGSSLP